MTEEVLNGKYVIRLSTGNNGYYVEIEAFSVVGVEYSKNGVKCTPKNLYPKKGAIHGLDSADSLDEAQRVITGSIKWDGCSDLTFFPDENGYNHFCGKMSAVEVGELISCIYDKAMVLLGDKVHDRDLYEGK